MCMGLSFLAIEKERLPDTNFPPEIDTLSNAKPGLGFDSLLGLIPYCASGDPR